MVHGKRKGEKQKREERKEQEGRHPRAAAIPLCFEVSTDLMHPSNVWSGVPQSEIRCDDISPDRVRRTSALEIQHGDLIRFIGGVECLYRFHDLGTRDQFPDIIVVIGSVNQPNHNKERDGTATHREKETDRKQQGRGNRHRRRVLAQAGKSERATENNKQRKEETKNRKERKMTKLLERRRREGCGRN